MRGCSKFTRLHVKRSNFVTFVTLSKRLLLHAAVGLRSTFAISDQPTPKLQSLLSQERLKLGSSNLAGIFKGSIRTQPMKKFGEKRAWAYPETAQTFFEYLLLSQERVKLQTSNLAGIFTGSIRTKAP